MNEETLEFVRRHRHDDVRSLALRSHPAGVDLPAALQQIAGWQAAAKKLPLWAQCDRLWFPPRLAMEQCSSQQTAEYKRDVVRRLLPSVGRPSGTMTDLTGGFGIDFSFMAPLFSRAVYMERQAELCRIARHNFGVLQLSQAEVIEGDSCTNPQCWPEADLYFIDPARRDAAGRRTVAIADCTPDLTRLWPVLQQKARLTLVKLSPMLDIHAALGELSGVGEVHAVCVQGECKELLFVMRQGSAAPLTFHCADIGAGGGVNDFVFTADDERMAECAYAAAPGRYLYEPNAAVLKCGGVRTVAVRFGLQKLHPNSHLYTSDRLCGDFPGRVFCVETVGGCGKKEAAALLRDVPRANLTVRNFPTTVAELRKRWRLKEGGDVYLFATTLHDGSHVLLRCRKADV